ncbi:MAG TPA: cytochrome c [Bryobacteraceae bacterium]|jgi:competence protein ComEA|nr:cytochrome c [Bryobacteraceae bacterium]
MWAKKAALLGAAVFAASLLAAGVFAADKAPARADPGKKLVAEICSFCHGLARLKDQSLTRDEWSNVIKGMVDEGAPVTDEEFSLILDYLAKNFGPAQEPAAQEHR